MIFKVQQNKRALISIGAIALLLLPLIASATPVDTNPEEPIFENWWDNTLMDKDGDGIHDAIWIAIDSTVHDWVDERGYIGVIVDFDHTDVLACYVQPFDTWYLLPGDPAFFGGRSIKFYPHVQGSRAKTTQFLNNWEIFNT